MEVLAETYTNQLFENEENKIPESTKPLPETLQVTKDKLEVKNNEKQKYTDPNENEGIWVGGKKKRRTKRRVKKRSKKRRTKRHVLNKRISK